MIDSRAALARLLLEVARPRPVQALASGQCRRPGAVQAHPQTTDADGTCRSAQGSQKNVSKPDGEDQSSRRHRSSKFPLKLNRISTLLLIVNVKTITLCLKKNLTFSAKLNNLVELIELVSNKRNFNKIC